MRDVNSPEKSSSVLILMKVIEARSSGVNSPPIISGDAGAASGSLVTSVTENEQIGRMITVVSATDPDGDSLCTHLLPVDDVDGTFGIHEGAVTLARSLDYEYKSKYLLVILVTDGIDYTITNVSAIFYF